MKKTLLFLFSFVFLMETNVIFAAWTPAETMPDDAILLFGTAKDGTVVNRFLSKEGTTADWKVEGGALVSSSRPIDAQNPMRSNHIFSDVTFQDAEIHVEFQVSDVNHGNSGVYIHGNYEMQIMNSFGNPVLSRDVSGALYGFYPPLVNASKPEGKWQSYDILFQAPRRDASGKIVKNGRLTAWLNGELVQDDVEFGEPVSHFHPYCYGETPLLRDVWKTQLETGFGPLFLQDHGSPAKFRNVWIRKISNSGT